MVMISFPLFLSLSISLPLLVEIAPGIPGEQRRASLTTRLCTYLEVSLASAHSQSSAESPVAEWPIGTYVNTPSTDFLQGSEAQRCYIQVLHDQQ